MNVQDINSRTDELTDTVQVVLECFPNLRVDHRPQDADWYRWMIYNERTSEVVGIIGLCEPSEPSISLTDIKVRLRTQVLALLAKAA